MSFIDVKNKKYIGQNSTGWFQKLVGLLGEEERETRDNMRGNVL